MELFKFSTYCWIRLKSEICTFLMFHDLNKLSFYLLNPLGIWFTLWCIWLILTSCKIIFIVADISNNLIMFGVFLIIRYQTYTTKETMNSSYWMWKRMVAREFIWIDATRELELPNRIYMCNANGHWAKNSLWLAELVNVRAVMLKQSNLFN